METQNEHQKFRLVCDAFGIGTLAAYEDIAEGVLNLNYKIYTDTGVYFVKGIRERKKDSVIDISQVETYMVRSGIPAIAMLTARSGESFFDMEGKRYTVYPFVESDRTHQYSIHDYVRMGEMLARIHLVSKEGVPSSLRLADIKDNAIPETIETLSSFARTIKGKDDQDATDTLFLEYIELKLRMLETMSDSREIFAHQAHVLHGDYHAGNFLIAKESREIIGICDWEKAAVGSRAHEVARSAMLLFDDFEREADLVKAYLKGYVSMYPLSKQELIEGFVFRIKAVVKSRWIEDLYYNHANSRSNHFIGKEMRMIRFFEPVLLGEGSGAFFDAFLG